MQPEFTSFYLSVILCSVCLSAQAASSNELMTSMVSDTSFEQEMADSMSKMDHDMAATPMTSDPNHDFSAMMIPHHQGAIDMAKGELLYGKDPVMRRLAQEILVDQQSEIDVMNLWLKKHGGASKGN